MKENIVKNKSFEFAQDIIGLYKLLQEDKEYIMSKQVLRSGTAIGAMVRESEHAESPKDFIHKLSVALKEANETDYWLELLYKGGYMRDKDYKNFESKTKELIKLLVSIIKTSKLRMK